MGALVVHNATHAFFNSRNFFYMHSPLITASDCEGAGEMFRVTTFDLDGGIDKLPTKTITTPPPWHENLILPDIPEIEIPSTPEKEALPIPRHGNSKDRQTNQQFAS